MKHLKSSAAMGLGAIVAIVAASGIFAMAGCGGSGSSGSSGTAPVTSLSNIRIEAIVLVSQSNLMHPSEWTPAQLLDPTNSAVKADLINNTVFGFQDMANFQEGEDYVFQLVGYTTPSSSNPYGRVVLGATFGNSDTTGAYGTLAANSGVFLASNNSTTSPLTVYAHYQGQDYTALFSIQPRQARVLGQVVTTGSKPVANVVVDFYDINGNVTGSVKSAVDGTYRASIPTASQTFTLDPHSLSTNVYGVFTIDQGSATSAFTYAAGDPACRAILTDSAPSISSGSLASLTVGTQNMFGEPCPPGSPTTVTLTTTSASSPSTNGCVFENQSVTK